MSDSTKNRQQKGRKHRVQIVRVVVVFDDDRGVGGGDWKQVAFNRQQASGSPVKITKRGPDIRVKLLEMVY